MPIRLLFITSQFFYPFTADSLQRMNLPCDTEIAVYNDFQHLLQVYQTLIPQFDACFVSGLSAKSAIELSFPNITKPLISFQVSPDALHRDFLRLAVEKQSLDFSRIVIDFLFPLDGGYTVSDYLAIDDLSTVFAKSRDWMQQHGVYGPEGIENYILNRIETLWSQKAIDLVVCQYSSLVPSLRLLGIPFHCPFLSETTLYPLIEQVLLKLELARLHDNNPAIVQIFPRHYGGILPAQHEQLLHHVQSFVQANLISCTIQNADGCCILTTSMHILRVLTNHFQICPFVSYLRGKLDFPVAVGYGIGNTPNHAMNNAQIASREAKLQGKSFVVDTNGSLIGPLNSTACMVLVPNSPADISELAKQCGLSSMTIQKLLTIVHMNGSNKLTTPELARQLDTTVRNANRIMQNLVKGGVAQSVYTQTLQSRGRPIQVYCLDFDVPFPHG